MRLPLDALNVFHPHGLTGNGPHRAVPSDLGTYLAICDVPLQVFLRVLINEITFEELPHLGDSRIRL